MNYRVGDYVQVFSNTKLWLLKRRVTKILEDGKLVLEAGGHSLDYEISDVYRKVGKDHPIWERYKWEQNLGDKQ